MSLRVAILAAGSARRMRGADKLLEPVAGVPVLRRIAGFARSAGPVAVTLRDPDPGRAAALTGLEVTLLPVPEASEGMAASIRAAVAWASGASGLILCPGDLPELDATDFAAVAAAFDAGGPPLRATDIEGRAGHPVAFGARFFPALATLTGDRGARELLALHPARPIPLPGWHATCDLDTPEDWAAWRAADRSRS